VVGGLLRRRGLTLAVAESATGGQLASLITEAAGASDYFVGGVVAYSRAAKEQLGVPAGVLDRHGTIAEETTRELARAARRRFEADVAIATTGVAARARLRTARRRARCTWSSTWPGAPNARHRYSTTRTEFKRRGALEALALLWRELRQSAE